MTASDWLLSVASLARKLNEESRNDSTRSQEGPPSKGGGCANNVPAANQ